LRDILPFTLHLQKALSYLGYKKGDFPVAERISQMSLALPMHPDLSEEEVARVASVIKEI